MPALDHANILDVIEGRLTEVLPGKTYSELRRTSRSSLTTIIKKLLGDVGKELGFNIAACGYDKADDGEWLYDMLWCYPMGNSFSRIALVAEIEHHLGTVADEIEVNGDFEKLIQARSDIRIWITACGNGSILKQHLEACIRRINSFEQSQDGDTYLFWLYDWTAGSPVTRRYIHRAR